MQASAKERWLSFLVWLGSGVSGISPFTLRLTLGPILALLPLARQVAREVSPWLLALLAERQRLGLVLAVRLNQEEADALAEDSSQQPYRRREAQRSPRWLGWLLTGELLRLARLVEAPEGALARREWLAWEVRYWALAVSLARIGQLYAELARRLGREAATRALEEALALAWSRATARAA
jgi:hypothetical protein